MTEPTKAPRTDDDCWPFPCASWHELADHLDGTDPCACPCHIEPDADPEGFR